MERFKVVNTKNGVPSIMFIENGEIMHNPVGPWQEALELYLKPMKFGEHLNFNKTRDIHDPLVVFDVGLGAGTNAAAALSAHKTDDRDLKVISFEKDLDLLRFAFLHRQEFPFLAPWEEAIEAILQKGVWQSSDGAVIWKLRHGDFPALIGKEPEEAEIIFFDPYSPKVNPEMWSIETFTELRQHARNSSPYSLLATYSRATSVRSALLLAGFYTGTGGRVGEKEETTMAATHAGLLPELLGQRWLERLKRSDVPFPVTASEDGWPELFRRLEQLPQFR